MAQHDYVIDNGPGLAVRTDINAVLQAIVTNNSGPIEPTATFPGMLWLDTSVVPAQLRQRNQGNTAWIAPNLGSIGTLGSLFLTEQATGPATIADQGSVYTKDVSGQTTLFYRRESAGPEIQVTAGGKVNGGAIFGATVNFTAGLFMDFAIPAGTELVELQWNGLSHDNAAGRLYVQMVEAGGPVNAGHTGAVTLLAASTAATAVYPVNFAPIHQVTTVAATASTGRATFRRQGPNAWLFDILDAVQGSASVSTGAGIVTKVPLNATAVRLGVTPGNLDSGLLKLNYW
jgi:hypothetical protein